MAELELTPKWAWLQSLFLFIKVEASCENGSYHFCSPLCPPVQTQWVALGDMIAACQSLPGPSNLPFEPLHTVFPLATPSYFIPQLKAPCLVICCLFCAIPLSNISWYLLIFLYIPTNGRSPISSIFQVTKLRIRGVRWLPMGSHLMVWSWYQISGVPYSETRAPLLWNLGCVLKVGIELYWVGHSSVGAGAGWNEQLWAKAQSGQSVWLVQGRGALE